MKLTTFLILRRLSIFAIPFLLSIAVLSAQIKINERVEINSDDGATSLTLNYPAELYISQFGTGDLYTPNNMITCGSDSVKFFIIDHETGQPIFLTGNSFMISSPDGASNTIKIFPAGTLLTFTEERLDDRVKYPLKIYEMNSNDCGGLWRLRGEYFLTSYFLQAGRTNSLLPYHISFEFDDPLSLMYTGSGFVPIHLMDCCGYSTLPSPVWYRVEVTTGKEWCSLYDESSGKRGTVVDSLYSPDGWSGFYLEAIGEEPSEPQQCSLTVSSYGNIVPSQTFDFLVTPFERTLTSTPGRKEISYGDTTLISLALLDEWGDPISEELLNVEYSIIKGNGYGTLQSLDSTVIGEWIEGVFPSVILRTIDDGNAPDSLDILIVTVATVPCPECGVILNKIASKDSSSEKGKDLTGIRNELLSQRLKRLPPTAQTNLQFAMQKKDNENQIQTRSSLITLDKVTPPSQTTRRSSPRLNKIQYDGPVKWYCGLTKVTVRKEPLCPLVEISKKNIYPGDTVFVSVLGKDKDNNAVPYPVDQTFDVSIPEGAEYGILKSLSTGRTGTSLTNDKGPFLFIVNDAINVNSCDIVIEAWPSDGGGTAPLMKGGAKSEPQSLSAKTKISARMLTVNSSCEPPKKTLSFQNITGLKLSTSLNYFSCQQSMPIEVSAQGGGTISDDAMVNVYTHADDAVFGNIVVYDSTGQSIKTATAMKVRYGDIRTGRVKFVPDCSHIQGRFPQGVRFGVDLAEKTKLAAANGVIVKGPNSGEWFTQEDPDWAGQQYDNYIDTAKTRITGKKTYHNIGDKGCALSCMAMAMSAYGTQIDPGKLATWMDGKGLWGKGGDVVWDAVGIYNEHQKFKEVERMGDGIDKGKILPKSDLDTYLSKGGPVLVQVANKGKNHWVLVTGKRGNNYDILDPGNRENIKTSLSEYGDKNNPIKIYGIRYFPSK